MPALPELLQCSPASHHIPAVLGREGVLPQGHSGSARLGGRGPAPPARSVLFPAVAVGSGREGTDAAAPAAKALPSACAGLPGWGGHRSPRPPHPGPGALQHGRMPCPPQNSVLRALGGCVGRGPGPCREEGSGGGLAACPPSSLCEVVGPLSPLGPSGRPVRPPPQALYPSPGLGLPTPMGQYGVCVGPTETRGGGGAGQRVAGLPRRARQRGHLGTIEHRHPVPGCVSREGGL